MKSIKLIPGVRYEHNTTEYTASTGVATLVYPDKYYEHADTTTIRENGFFLPMIHLKYSPADGFDIRLAYTKTLSHPGNCAEL